MNHIKYLYNIDCEVLKKDNLKSHDSWLVTVNKRLKGDNIERI